MLNTWTFFLYRERKLIRMLEGGREGKGERIPMIGRVRENKVAE